MSEIDQALDRIKQLPELIGRAGEDYALKKSEFFFMEKKKDATHAAIMAELSTKNPDAKENKLKRMADSQLVWVDFLNELKQAKYNELLSLSKRDELKSELDTLRTLISHETAKIRMI